MPIWRSPHELQFGESKKALRITGLSPGQERLITLLYRGVADSYYSEVAKTVGATQPEILLKQIEPVLLDRASEPTSLSAEFIENHFADICRAQAMHNTDGAVVIEARHQATVYVEGCYNVSKHIVESLARSGVGKIVLDTESDFELRCQTIELKNLRESQLDEIDFAILVSNNAVSPRSYTRWLRRSVAHLSVVFDSDGVSISPTVHASKTACLNCFHENQTSQDSAWPAVASQLLFSKQRFDDVSASHFAASIACQRALQLIDESLGFRSEPLASAGYRLSLASSEISEFTWQFSDTCLCRGY